MDFDLSIDFDFSLDCDLFLDFELYVVYVRAVSVRLFLLFPSMPKVIASPIWVPGTGGVSFGTAFAAKLVSFWF